MHQDTPSEADHLQFARDCSQTLLVSAEFARRARKGRHINPALREAAPEAIFAVPFGFGFDSPLLSSTQPFWQISPETTEAFAAFGVQMPVFPGDVPASSVPGTYTLPFTPREALRIADLVPSQFSEDDGTWLGRLARLVDGLNSAAPTHRTEEHAFFEGAYRLFLAIHDWDAADSGFISSPREREALHAAADRVAQAARDLGALEPESWEFAHESFPRIIKLFQRHGLDHWLSRLMGCVYNSRPRPPIESAEALLARIAGNWERNEETGGWERFDISKGPRAELVLMSERYAWELRAAAFGHEFPATSRFRSSGYFIADAEDFQWVAYVGPEPDFGWLKEAPPVVFFSSPYDRYVRGQVGEIALPMAPVIPLSPQLLARKTWAWMNRTVFIPDEDPTPLGNYEPETDAVSCFADFAREFPAVPVSEAGPREHLLWRGLRFRQWCHERIEGEGPRAELSPADELFLEHEAAWFGFRRDGTLALDSPIVQMTESDRVWMGKHYDAIATARHLYLRHTRAPVFAPGNWRVLTSEGASGDGAASPAPPGRSPL